MGEVTCLCKRIRNLNTIEAQFLLLDSLLGILVGIVLIWTGTGIWLALTGQ